MTTNCQGKMEDSVEDCHVRPDEENDEEEYDYEFDAAMFFDFTRPETNSEIEAAERWFEVSGDYPPSPFTVKLNLEKLLSGEIVVISSKAKHNSNSKSISSTSDADSRTEVSTSKQNSKGMPQDTPKSKTNSADKSFQPRSSTLMEPTASHLAKQYKTHEKHSGHICTRFQKTSAKLDQKGIESPTGLYNPATKRQKLETGYLKKVAQLKHQYSLLHKSTKKVTVPREPELETMLRAQRRGSKNSSASSETEKQKQKEFNFKAHPLNKKAPSLLQRKKSTPQSPEFQVFQFKTTERAHHHALAKVYPSVTDTDLNQGTKQKSTLTEPRLSSKLLESPPIEQFSELSLGSDTKTSNASQIKKHTSAKGLKKDAHDSFQAEFWKCHAKTNQCGGHTRVHEAKCWSNMTRSLDIR